MNEKTKGRKSPQAHRPLTATLFPLQNSISSSDAGGSILIMSDTVLLNDHLTSHLQEHKNIASLM